MKLQAVMFLAMSFALVLVLSTCTPTEGDIKTAIALTEKARPDESLPPTVSATTLPTASSPTESAAETTTDENQLPVVPAKPESTVSSETAELHEQPRWFLMGRPGGVIEGPTKLVISTVNPDYRYLTMADKGILISVNGGLSWTNSFEGFAEVLGPSWEVADVIAHPTADRTLYALVSGIAFTSHDAGMSWEQLTSFPIYAMNVASDGQTIYALGVDYIVASKDGGETWPLYFQLPEGIETRYRGQIAVDSQNPDTAYVVVLGNLFITNSGGQQWSTPSLLNTGITRDVLTDRTLSGIGYVRTDGNALYRTSDGGNSWGLVADLNSYSQPRLHFADAGKVLLTVVDDSNNYVTAVYASTNRGETWDYLSHIPSIPNADLFQVYSLIADPAEEKTLYGLLGVSFQTVGLMRSTDSGATWHMYEPIFRPKRISVSRDGEVIYVSGSNISRSEDGGNSWRDITDGLEDAMWREYYAIAQDPQDHDTAYAAITRDSYYSSIYRTEDGGLTWEAITEIDEYGLTIVVNPGNPDLVYVAQPNILSTDGGNSWVLWSTVEGRVFPIEVNPTNPLHVLLGKNSFDGGLYWSQNGGETVQIRGLGADFKIHCLAYNPSNTQIVYAVAETADRTSLYTSQDEGATWSVVASLEDIGSVQYYGYNQETYYCSLFVDPSEPNTLYLSRGDVFRSIDGGETWHDYSLGITPDERITEMVMATKDPPILYAVGNSGVWKLVLSH